MQNETPPPLTSYPPPTSCKRANGNGSTYTSKYIFEYIEYVRIHVYFKDTNIYDLIF